MMNEAVLISLAALTGDRKAFGKLVEIYQSPVRRFLYNLTRGDEDLSKDLAQETFIKAWLNIRAFRSASKFSTWLYRIAYNTFYDYSRTRKNNYKPDLLPDNDRGVGNAFNEFNVDFMRALELLNDDERTAMLLFYMEDMSINRIAEIMCRPSGSIKSHLHRGKNKLEQFFSNSGYDKQ